jgi:hypothetical protein
MVPGKLEHLDREQDPAAPRQSQCDRQERSQRAAPLPPPRFPVGREWRDGRTLVLVNPICSRGGCREFALNSLDHGAITRE